MSANTLECAGWGLCRLSNAEHTERYTFASICAGVPSAVLCLVSALQVHEIGTQLPRHVWLAIENKAKPPVMTKGRDQAGAV